MVNFLDYEGMDPAIEARKAAASLSLAKRDLENVRPFLFNSSSGEEFDERIKVGEVPEIIRDAAERHGASPAKVISTLRREFLVTKTGQYEDYVTEDDYDHDDHKQFVRDMQDAGHDVEHYNGRYYWSGPAVRVDDIQDALSYTKVPCQWDNMGLGWIVYPRTSGPRKEATKDDPRCDKCGASLQYAHGKNGECPEIEMLEGDDAQWDETNEELEKESRTAAQKKKTYAWDEEDQRIITVPGHLSQYCGYCGGDDDGIYDDSKISERRLDNHINWEHVETVGGVRVMTNGRWLSLETEAADKEHAAKLFKEHPAFLKWKK